MYVSNSAAHVSKSETVVSNLAAYVSNLAAYVSNLAAYVSNLAAYVSNAGIAVRGICGIGENPPVNDVCKGKEGLKNEKPAASGKEQSDNTNTNRFRGGGPYFPTNADADTE
jgi:hypothetical protein